MNLKLIYRFEAENDLADIEEYYSEILPSLTKGFFDEYFETIRFIENEPQLFQVRYRDIRIAPLYRFPYGIHCKQADDEIIIFRVLHTKRYFK